MKNEESSLKQLKTKSILYIEDEDNIRKELTATLQLLCKEVFSFSSAEQGLDFFSKTKPDMILSDISLGELSGLEFAKKIRELDKKIPIILLSAHTDTSFLLQAAKLKLVDYLTKPISFNELQQSLFLALEEVQVSEKRFVNISSTMKYDILHKVLYENDTAKKLSSSETHLLDFLIKNKNRTITIEEIKNFIWDDPYYVTETAFKSLLHKLRNKVGKNSIKNVSGVGYYIIVE
jgi:DNA-binding response OmpR family regulator